MELIANVPAPPPRVQSVARKPKLFAKALFDFAGGGPNEMKLKAGEVVEVTERGAPGAWCKGLTGAFPTDYVEFILPEAAAAATVAATPAVHVPEPAAKANLLDISSAFDNIDINAFGSVPMQSSTASRTSDLSSMDSFTPTTLTPTTSTASAAAATQKPAPPGATGGAQTSKQSREDALRFIYEADVPTKAPKPKAGAKPAVNSMDALFAQAATGSTTAAPATTDRNSFTATAAATPQAAATTSFATSASVNASAANSRPASNVASAAASPARATTTSTPAVAVAPPKNSVFALVKYSRVAGGSTELTITEGETLLVIKQDGEWWYGSSLDAQAKSGYFPGNYVELKVQPAPVQTVDISTSSLSTNNQYNNYATTSSVMTSAQYQYTATDLQAAGGGVNWSLLGAGLDGTRYVYQSQEVGSLMRCPVWQLPAFMDLFADAYKRKLVEHDAQLEIPAVRRIGAAVDTVERALSTTNLHEQVTVPLMVAAISRAVNMLKEGREVCRQIPVGGNDSVQFFTFLMGFLVRVRNLRPGESMMVPTSWFSESGMDQAVIMVLTKESENPEDNYTIAVVNAGNTPQQGLDFHPFAVDPTHGHLQRNLSMEMVKIPENRMTNATFW